MEDEVIVALDLQGRLEALGYRVLDAVTSGEQACQKALMLHPDLVLMDIRLSGDMDGIEAASTIRAQIDIPIVFVTAYADQDTLQRAKITGPYGYIIKPFDNRDLHATLEIAQYKYQLEYTLRKSRDELLAILNAQRHGTLMMDERGRITFLSLSAQRMLSVGLDEALNSPLQSVLGLKQQDRRRLETMFQLPTEQRTKVPCRIRDPGGRDFFLEIEVQDDPRTVQRKILFLYDVSELNTLRELLNGKARFHNIVGHSKPVQEMIQLVRRVAQVDSTVLIEGETGTGKELVARAIHNESSRKDGPFIAFSCAGLSAELASSQFFGHKRGAFTGAVNNQLGLFEAANGGTLFLDELGELDLSIQSTLLRVLEERVVTPVGTTESRKIDIRFLAATNRDLAKEVDHGRFRSDLFYRIRVAHIRLPPLRERREDILLLVRTFLLQLRATLGKNVDTVSNATMQALLAHKWPGNIRELKNALEFAVIRCAGTVIQSNDLPPEMWQSTHSSRGPSDESASDERGLIVAALERTGGNRKEAAKLLGMSRATLYRRLTEHDLV